MYIWNLFERCINGQTHLFVEKQEYKAKNTSEELGFDEALELALQLEQTEKQSGIFTG